MTGGKQEGGRLIDGCPGRVWQGGSPAAGMMPGIRGVVLRLTGWQAGRHGGKEAHDLVVLGRVGLLVRERLLEQLAVAWEPLCECRV